VSGAAAPGPPEPRTVRVRWRWDALSLGSLVGIAALIGFLYLIREVLLVLVMSVFLAYVLEPLVHRLERVPLGRGRRLGRKPAAGIVVLFGITAIGLGLYWLVPVLWNEINRLGAELPRYYKLIEDWMLDMASSRGMGLPPEFWTSVQDQYHALVQNVGSGFSGWAMRAVSSLASLLGLVVVPVGAFYVLADGSTLTKGFVDGLPVSWRPIAEQLLASSDHSLETYVRGQTLVVLVVSVLAGVLFTLLGVHYSLALGALAGLAEAVPFLGSISVIVSLVLVSWDRGPSGLAIVLGAYVALNQVNNYVITPRLMGQRLELHPFVVILAVLAGSSLGGFVGAVLALPATAVLVGLGGTLWGAGRPASGKSRA
jgi:predicted PurR-regulated permease PerM